MRRRVWKDICNNRHVSPRWMIAASAMCAATATMLVSSTGALASPGYEFSSSFGSFQHPEAIAIDQANNYVYVIDLGSTGDTVKRFNATGTPVSFSAAQPYVHNNELIGTPTELFSFDSGGSAAELAVDNSGGPANGDLYVTDSNNRKVDVFASSGSFLGEVNPSLAAPEAEGEPCGVAVDSAGNVYVAHATGHIDRYRPTDSNPADDVFSGQLENVGEVCQVAVNSSGDVYADLWRQGPLRVYEPSQFGLSAPSGREIDAKAFDIATDPADEHVFVDEQTQITEYDASGNPVGQPFGSGVVEESAGVGVDGSSGNVYVANGMHTNVDLFVVPVPSAPIIKNEYAADVTSESAELGAEVKPGLHDTKYFFRYGTDTSYSGGEVPVAPGSDIGSGSAAVAVHGNLTELAAGVTYHYQVVAENELGTKYSEDHTFTTFPETTFALPDNRAWEMVSPLEKNGADVLGIFAGEENLGSGAPIQASPEGDAVTYAAIGAFAGPHGATRGSQYLSVRGPNGWTTQNIMPPLVAGSYGIIGHGTPYKAFTENLSHGLLNNGDTTPVENPPLAPGLPTGYENFYIHSFIEEGYQALLTSTPAESPGAFSMELEGATPDLSHVVFATEAALTAGTVDIGHSAKNLYEWSSGSALQPVNVLPNGAPAPGAQVGSGPFEASAVSDDGSRVFWSYEGTLYMHEGGSPTTEIGESGIFKVASSSGSQVFFTDGLRLTGDSTAHGRGVGEDLYVFSANMPHQLTDITVDHNPADEEGAAVEGVLGASANGAYVYFVAKGNLAGEAVSGGNNLYVWHEGEVKFIATLSGEDEKELVGTIPGVAHDWSGALGSRTARVTPSGEFALFMSSARLTGYDNTDLVTGKPDEEVYLYDAPAGRLTCVSCNPTNGRPIGPASIPAGSHFQTGRGGESLYQPRALAEDGNRVFFETKDALVPQDTNDQWDVYEYENGHVYLISSGTSSEESSFMDASANGSDVFFVTRQELVPQDTDTLVDLYDARENGGFPSAPAILPSCNGESCKPAASLPPVFGASPSMATGESENSSVHPAKKVKAKSKHKPTKSRTRKRVRKIKPHRKARAGGVLRHGAKRETKSARSSRAGEAR